MRHALALPAAALLLAGCAPKPAEQQAAAPAAVDSAAVKTGLDSLRAEYMRRFAAGDAAGIAGLYLAAGNFDFYGAPKMRGRAGIEAGLKAAFVAQKPISVDIVATATNARTNSDASEIGTYHEMDNVKGKTFHAWGRWVTSAAKDSTGAWRLAYLMAFPDSTKTDK
jgi:hypothetical protein